MPSSRWILASALLVAGLAGAAPASATAPMTTIEQRHVQVTHGDCGSFTLIFEADVTRTLTTFHDRDGIPVRDVLVRRAEGTVSNSVTGESLPSTTSSTPTSTSSAPTWPAERCPTSTDIPAGMICGVG